MFIFPIDIEVGLITPTYSNTITFIFSASSYFTACEDEFRCSNAAEGGSTCAHSVRFSTMPEEDHVVACEGAAQETIGGSADAGTYCAIKTSECNSAQRFLAAR